MILAAADAARKRTPPPPELVLAWRCEQYRTLPRAGGLWDQPFGLVEKMTVCLNVYNACREWARGVGKDWIKNNRSTFEILQAVWELDKNEQQSDRNSNQGNG